MSDQRPEIQRYTPAVSYFPGGIRSNVPVAVLDCDDSGPVVRHSDHLRHLTLAKIEVLEEINDDADSYMDSETGEDAHWAVKQSTIQAQISALRKELGE